jgi:hypothetical protein
MNTLILLVDAEELRRIRYALEFDTMWRKKSPHVSAFDREIRMNTLLVGRIEAILAAPADHEYSH